MSQSACAGHAARNAVLVLLGIAVATLLASCAKPRAQDAAPQAQTPTLVHEDAGPMNAAPASPNAAHDKLAIAYHSIRCALTGRVPNPEKLYSKLGFSDSLQFSTAFDAAAKADPDWAQAVIKGSLERACTAPAGTL